MCKNLFQLTVWHEIFAGSNFCDSYSDPQKKGAQINITANIFPAQFTPEQIFSNLNSLHENAELRSRVYSVTTCLFRSETKRYTMNLLVLHRVRTQ